MARRPGRVIGALSVLITLGLGYAAADAVDAVPGFITVSQAPPAAQDPPAISAQVPPVPAIPDLAHDDAAASASLDTRHVQALVDVTTSYFGKDFAPELEREEGVDPRIGIAVYDVVGQKMVAEQLAKRALSPASSTKLVTAAAALHTLGADKQFTTRVMLADSTVYLVGGGDVLLGTGPSDPEAVNGRVGLQTLAEDTAAALKSNGLTEVDLAVDVSLFDTRSYAPGTENGDDRWTMPASPIAINANRGERSGSHLDRPAERTGQAFAEALGAQGITVTSRSIADTPPTAQEITSGQSAPLRDILTELLPPSDNAIAETLGLLVAQAQGRSADYSSIQPAMAQSLQELGFTTEGMSMVNSSGLARATVIPPQLLAEIVSRAAAPTEGPLVPLVKALPIGGLEGTLWNRQLDFPGAVRAKTGTLMASVSLTGIVRTGDGHLLAFSIVADQLPPGGIFEARQRIDEFAKNLAQCACALPDGK